MHCAEVHEMACDKPPVLTIFDPQPVVLKHVPAGVTKNRKRDTDHEQQACNLPVYPALKQLIQTGCLTFEEAHV